MTYNGKLRLRNFGRNYFTQDAILSKRKCFENLAGSIVGEPTLTTAIFEDEFCNFFELRLGRLVFLKLPKKFGSRQPTVFFVMVTILGIHRLLDSERQEHGAILGASYSRGESTQ